MMFENNSFKVNVIKKLENNSINENLELNLSWLKQFIRKYFAYSNYLIYVGWLEKLYLSC